MDDNELLYARGVLLRLAQAARGDLQLAQQIRELVLASGILAVFDASDGVNLLDLIDVGGVALLRTQLGGLSLAQLRHVVAANQYDPEKVTARWRSSARLVDLIVSRALEQLERRDRSLLELEYAAASEPPKSPSGASWML